MVSPHAAYLILQLLSHPRRPFPLVRHRPGTTDQAGEGHCLIPGPIAHVDFSQTFEGSFSDAVASVRRLGAILVSQLTARSQNWHASGLGILVISVLFQKRCSR